MFVRLACSSLSCLTTLAVACSAPDDGTPRGAGVGDSQASGDSTTSGDATTSPGASDGPAPAGSDPATPSATGPPLPDTSPTSPTTVPAQSTTPTGGGGQPPAGGSGQPPQGGGGAPGGAGVNGGLGGTVAIAGMGGIPGGAAASAGGNPSGGNMNLPEDVVPTLTGQDYTLAMGNIALVANGPSGRITQLNIEGANFLTSSSVNDLNYGSSFWTSPQEVWGWPPPFDGVTYTHAIDGNSILFTAPATTQGSDTVSITKRFSADTARQALVTEFTITNDGAAAFSAAPWQITRVVPQGLTFYPTGGSVVQAEIPTTDMGGVTWLDYAAGGITAGTKNIADGAEGWLAHVNGSTLFLKVFPDVPDGAAAPGEGEVEIYIEELTTYVELEPQGPYAAIQPGETTAPWRVLWLVRTVPAEVPVSVGSAELLGWVRGIVAGL